MRLRRARPESRLQFIVLVTYGRTGSTALQACLNALPGVRVRGENYAALRGLRQYMQCVAETASRHHSGRPDHPWFGSARLDPTGVLAGLQEHVVEHLLRPAADTRVLGFKEIRYEPGHFGDYDDMLDYLVFLGKILPGVSYLMNVRDPQDVARSGWWPERRDAVASLAMARDWLVDAVADLNSFYGSERAVLVEYERWAEDSSVLIEAFAALGLPRDDEAVRQACGTHLAHGPHGDGGAAT